MKNLIILIALIFISGCTDPDSAYRTLDGAGFKNIQLTGYRVYGCSKDDVIHTGFVATNISGRKVSGVVCSGLLTGSSIRYD